MKDPEVIKFCNEQLRPAMDAVGRAYWRVKKLVAIYEAKALESKLGSADSPELVEDGSATDGRSPIYNATVLATLANIGGIISALETADPKSGYTLIQGVLSVAVNPEG